MTCNEEDSGESVYEFVHDITECDETETVDECRIYIFGCTFPKHFSTITRHLLKPRMIIIETKIDKITAETFDEKLNADFLTFSNTDVSQIDERAFFNLTNLKCFHVSGGNLESLPQILFGFNPKLKTFEMRDNKIELKIEGKLFMNKPRLMNVILVNCRIKKIPEDMFSNTTNIQSINFSGNDLTTISMRSISTSGSRITR